MTTSAHAAEWEWILTAYLWGSDTSVDVFVSDEPVFGGDLEFSDLLDKLEFGAQSHFEGRRGKGGFFLDATFLHATDSQIIEAQPLLPGGTEVRTDSKLILVEAGGSFRPGGGAHGFDLLFGVRVIDIDMDIDITPPQPLMPTRVSASDTLTDGFVGMRYVGPLGEKWLYTLRGDVGAGDSDRVWNLMGILGYSFGKNGRYVALVGYRHMVAKYETTDVVTVETEVTMSGPMAGFAFRF